MTNEKVRKRLFYFVNKNILNKTIKAMDFVTNTLQLSYDFLIRTNITTVLNIPQLLKELAPLPRENICIGGNKMQLKWICPSYGVTDNRYRDRWFIQGTSIIFSKDVCKNIVKNQNKIEKTIVDDISLFMYLANFNEPAYQSINQHAISFYQCNESMENFHKIPLNKAFYRNKTEDMRDDDMIRLTFLCNHLQF